MTLTENNHDFTRPSNLPPNNNPFITNKYRAYGVEFTGNVAVGDFRLTANMTYTDAKTKAGTTQPLTAGNRPGGLPKFQYFIQPSYDRGIAAIGFTIGGQTAAALDDVNTRKLKPTTYVNGFLKLRPAARTEIGANVSSIFNTLGYRGGGSFVPAGNGPTLFQGIANYGRTIEASVRYTF